MDLAREGTPPGTRTSLLDLSPPRRSDRLPPVASPRARSLSPRPAEESPVATPKGKKKKKKKKRRGSKDSSHSCPPGPEEDTPSDSSSPTFRASGAMSRTPCKWGAECYRKNPEHKRQYSHPGDPDHPETEAPEPPARAVVSEPESSVAPEAVLEDGGPWSTDHLDRHDSVASVPRSSASAPLKSGSDLDLPGDDGGASSSNAAGVARSSSWHGWVASSFPSSSHHEVLNNDLESVHEGDEKRSGGSGGSGSSGGVAVEAKLDVVEAVSVGRVGRTATRPVCRYGASCYRHGVEHRAEYAHPGDPDHPETTTPIGAVGREVPASNAEEEFEELEDVEAPRTPEADGELEEDDQSVPERRNSGIDFACPPKNWKQCKFHLCLACTTVVAGSLVSFTIVLFLSMVTLREDQQLIEKTWDGERISDGPGVYISWPGGRLGEYVIREVDRLSPLEYAVVKNRRTQVVRHQLGPGLLFMRAFEDLEEILPLKKLQLTQYHRLIDELVGDERIVRGPTAYAPEPLEKIAQQWCWKSRSLVQDEGESLGEDANVATLENCKLKCEGLQGCQSFTTCQQQGTTTCHYKDKWTNEHFPAATTSRTSTSTTTTTSTSTSTSSTSTSSTWTSAVNGSNATSTTASASPVEDSSSNETSTLTSTVFSNATTTTMIDLPENVSENVSSYNTSDRRLAEAWRIEDCQTVFMEPCSEDLPEEAVMINVFWGMIVENKSSGLLRLVKTPGLFFPEAYEVLREWRPAKLIDELSYAAIKDTLTGEITVRPGPTLVMLEAYEELLMIGSKVVIKKDEYLRLIDQRTGHERVVLGPGAVSPGYEEVMPDGVQAAAMIDDLTSAVSLDRTTGLRSLHAAPVSTGLLMPAAYETLLEVRPRIRVLDHQAVVSKTVAGQLTVHTSSFFLAPFDEIFAFPWSLYQDYQPEPAPKISATILDLRVQRLPWRFLALTQDNVRLELTGNTFWQISNVVTMATATEDAPADVAARSRAEVLSRVAEAKYRDFMASLSSITAATTAHSSSDSFYSQRGLSVSRVEIIGYEAVDEGVAEVLRSTVVEVTAQVNRLIQAQTLIDVNASKMSGEIRLEKLRTAFITHKANNDLLLAMNEGAKEGTRLVEEAKTFLDGLNTSITEAVSRVDLYRQYHEQDAINELTKLFADGPSKFYLHANDTDLVLSNYRTEL
ncbi:Hypothetical protein SCF082_LOCUS4279 [Durusdinium trenchii]|uniref:PBZ-type domain-containing protein n=1 Tax=Durusdinium trenchii TaxID=1381693 RepID=A0ABP0I1V6_9DINO